MKKLIATALSDEKDVIYITVTLKREEVRMLVSVEFVPQEKRLMCCSYMTTLSQPGECTPLKTQKLYGGCCHFRLAVFISQRRIFTRFGPVEVQPIGTSRRG